MPLHKLYLLLVLFVLGCTQHLPTEAEKTLLQATVFNFTEARETLQKVQPSLIQIDSLSEIIQESHRADMSHSIMLNSSGDTPWGLGIKPPNQIQPRTKYPLIIYLHGGINNGQDAKGATSYEMFDFLSDTLDCYIASPSGNRYARWWESKGIARVFLAVRYMTLNYPIDPEKIILAGVSDGGTATFALAQQPNHPFTDIWAISGFPPLLPQMGITFDQKLLSRVPIYMINSGNDRLYPSEQVLQFSQAIKKTTIPLEFKFYPNQEHGFDYKAQETATLVKRVHNAHAPLSRDQHAITNLEEYFSYIDTYNAIPLLQE